MEDLLSRMTLAEKVGQMTLPSVRSLEPQDVSRRSIGALLSGGGQAPGDRSASAWAAMVREVQEAALASRLGIPLLYGIDAVHGHNNVRGAVIFPHNVGLGATRDPDLVWRVARATAEEMAATGIRWNFAPVLAVPQDLRWGRTYEAFGERTELVTRLGTAYLRGLQGPDGATDLAHPLAVLATPKHYVGDGAAAWGTSTTGTYRIDQGDARLDEAALRAMHLAPYRDAVEAGALSIMASFSSWNGRKLHAHHYLLTRVLKEELGFRGFVVSDWGGIDQVDPSYERAVVESINAGIDMVMAPTDYERFMDVLTKAVESGAVSQTRVDDAVRRILRAKMSLGLFERPHPEPGALQLVGSDAHRSLARQAVARSLVLLKNEGATLPLPTQPGLILVAGRHAHDIGLQCGGWTIEWQGRAGPITPGTTILEGIRAAVGSDTRIVFDRHGRFPRLGGTAADVGIVVVGEEPYAEGVGDKEDLSLTQEDLALIEGIRPRVNRLIVVLVSGRPLILGPALEQADALVAAWLPGSEAAGVADALFGRVPFTGRLPYSWPRAMEQVPLSPHPPAEGPQALLFPYGFGLEAHSRR